MASAFLIPWLFLNQINGLQLPQEDYNSLTSKSRDLYENRIDLSLWIISNIHYIFLILIFIGILCIAIGLYFWIKKQKIKDQIEIYSRDKLKIETLNPEATDNKREEDVKEELSNLESFKNVEKADPEKEDSPTSKTDGTTIDQLKKNLEQIERLFFNKIEKYNPFNYKPTFNVKVDKFLVDILLKSTIVSKYRDKYIEIKYFQQSLNFELFQKYFGQTVRLRNHIMHLTNRLPTFYLFIVYNNEIASKEEIQRFKKATSEYLTQFRDIEVKVIILSEEEAENYDISQIFK